MRTLVTLSLLTLLAMPARADQLAWITKEQAESAAKLIKEGDEVRLFCSPCGEKGYQKIVITKKEVSPVGSENDHQLKLNGEGVDLAYTYIKQDGKWKDLGMALKAEVNGVPEFLPDDLKEVPPEDKGLKD